MVTSILNFLKAKFKNHYLGTCLDVVSIHVISNPTTCKVSYSQFPLVATATLGER